MRRILAVFIVLITGLGVALALTVQFGLPMRALRPPDGAMIGAINAVAIDTSRPDLFSGVARRVVPLLMLYPASAPGTYAPYVPDAGPQIDAIAKSHGWTSRFLLGQIGTLVAPWTDAARPSAGGQFPVIIYLPGMTGYMQMGSFQTTELAAQGYVVVTLNQPGAVPSPQCIGTVGHNLAQRRRDQRGDFDRQPPTTIAHRLNPQRDIPQRYSGYTKNLFLDLPDLANCENCPEEG